MKIVTDVYRQSASQCGRKAALALLNRWWWAFALPIAMALVASMWDWRWIVAAMALALVAYPFVLMMAYYSCVLKPEAAKGLLSRRVEIGDGGIDIVYEQQSEDRPAPEPEHIMLDRIVGYEDRGDAIAIKHLDGELVIPVSALDRHEAADLTAFLSRLV